MRCAALMDIDRRAQFGETPRGAGVIEMNVAEKNVANVARRDAELRERGCDGVERRFRSGIEKHRAFVCLEQGRRDDATAAEMQSVENVNHVL